MRVLSWIFAILTAVSLPAPVYAYDWAIVGHVTAVEATYVPDKIPFALDAGVQGCAAGQMLYWSAKGTTEASKVANI